MFHLFKRKKDKYILLFVIVALSGISVSKHKDRFIKASMNPYSYFVGSSLSKIRSAAEKFFINLAPDNLREEQLSNLTSTIEELKWKNRIYKNQLKQLSKLYTVKLDFSFANDKFVVSQIIARDINYNGRFWINLGKSDHISKGTPIVTKDLKLVGTVKKVSDSQSSVWSILTKNNVIDAIDSKTGGWGIYYGQGKPFGLYTYFSETPLSVGDIIKTSGLDGKYPKDITIGKVMKIIKTDSLKTVAVIKPAALPGKSLYLVAIIKHNDMDKSSSNIHNRNSS